MKLTQHSESEGENLGKSWSVVGDKCCVLTAYYHTDLQTTHEQTLRNLIKAKKIGTDISTAAHRSRDEVWNEIFHKKEQKKNHSLREYKESRGSTMYYSHVL